jgi:hypothetical protein
VEDEELKKAIEEWDGLSRDGEILTKLVDRWVDKMILRLFKDEVGLMVMHRDGKKVLSDPLLYLLEGEKSGLKLRHDWVDGLDLKAEAKAALEEALKKDREKLKYRTKQIGFGGTVGKVPSAKGRGTYQMAVEITDKGPVAWTLAAPGQNEDPDSPHYSDQIGLFREWKYKRFPFTKDELLK